MQIQMAIAGQYIFWIILARRQIAVESAMYVAKGMSWI